MTESAAAAATRSENALVALLDRSSAFAAAPGGVRDPQAMLGERALLGPLREFLGRPGKHTRARLFELAYCAAGGAPGELPSALPLALEALHAGSLIIDDIEDDSDMRRGAPSLHRIHGVPLSINAANWLYFFAQDLIARAPLPDAARLCALGRTTACLLRCHEGQALDLGTRVFDLAQADVPQVVRSVTALKTGALVSLSMELAALSAAAPDPICVALAEFGRDAGVAVQMLDDLSGLLNAKRRAKALEDLRLARPTWLWAWLASDAEREPYEHSRAALRAVAAGAPADALLDSLRQRTGVIGRLRARRELDAAFARLADVLGASERLSALNRQLRDLERMYVGE